MEVWGITHRGVVRQQNQDAFSARTMDDGRVIALVCDGMGGARAGNVASAMAVDLFMDRFLRESGDDQERMQRAASQANQEIFQKAATDEDCTGMGTTLVAAWVQADLHAYVLNVGDSRAYHICPSGISQITRDHSLVADLVARGKITPEEARTHPNKNIITRALGTERHTDGDLFEVDLESGDFILLCSDGLSNVVTEQEILYEALYGGSEETCCRRLLDIALHRGAPDNVTVVLICTGGENNQ